MTDSRRRQNKGWILCEQDNSFVYSNMVWLSLSGEHAEFSSKKIFLIFRELIDLQSLL